MKVLRKCYNTAMVEVLLIYPYFPSGLGSRAYILVKPLVAVLLIIIILYLYLIKMIEQGSDCTHEENPPKGKSSKIVESQKVCT